MGLSRLLSRVRSLTGKQAWLVCMTGTMHEQGIIMVTNMYQCVASIIS